MDLKYNEKLELYKYELESACDKFKELVCSDLVAVCENYIILMTRTNSVGAVIHYCPYCGCKIKYNYNIEKEEWEWWHN